MSNVASKIPVTVLTGFLGAGKTTLLNHLLSQLQGKRIGIIENEFGEISIDHDLVVRGEEEVFEINNGCLCCTVRGDLVRILHRFMQMPQPFDYILIETTGLAHPGPVMQTFTQETSLQEAFYLDGLVTVADAVHLAKQLKRKDEARAQLAFASVVVLNKTDEVEPEKVALAIEQIQQVNPLANVIPSSRGQVQVEGVLYLKAFDLKNEAGNAGFLLGNLHSLKEMLKPKPQGILQNNSHTHNKKVSSVAVRQGSPVNHYLFSEWMQGLLDLYGDQLYRTKGILWLPHDPRQFIFQSVHRMFTGTPGRMWKEGEERVSQIVFIGKDLDTQDIRKGFMGCLQQPTTEPVSLFDLTASHRTAEY
jgi:G3E family GTPase